MDRVSQQAALGIAREIACEAGALVMGGFRTRPRTEKKGRIDLVTQFDLESERLIRERLQAAFPHDGLVAEELEGADARTRTWYVDPIDGTTNFAHGHPCFAVSIAMYDDQGPALGVVHAPALGVTWAAARGLGALRNGEACRVSETADLQDALCATGFPYDRATTHENNFREHVTFMRRVQGVRRCGSAAIDLALVADGTYDGYWEQKLKPWDMAAGAVLISEAGGQLSDYDGTPPDPLSGRLVASNGMIHRAMLDTLREARALAPL